MNFDEAMAWIKENSVGFILVRAADVWFVSIMNPLRQDVYSGGGLTPEAAIIAAVEAEREGR